MNWISCKSCVLLVGIFGVFSANAVVAQDDSPTDAQVRYFETHIRPALVTYCYQCHSIEEGDSRAGLLLDTRDDMLQGGDSGPAIVPGNLDESLLWEAINWDGYEMPPSEQMPVEVIEHFRAWIEMGAPDPRRRELLTFNSNITEADIEQGRSHWSFQPPTSVADASIDGLVDAELRRAELEPSPRAEAATLLRRLNFDLIGLPPTYDEIVAFERAWQRNAESAIENKVEELLDRPQYGERWGRHWMDVARYSESSGVLNVTFPHAWRYRDYVIDAFNDDTPYDRFLTEQIAGDLLPADTDAEWQENLIATGFLAIGSKRLNERNPRKFMADMIDEQVDTVSQVVLGMTVACARCHDHKFDPIPTQDYYALAGIFRSTATYYGTVSGQQNHRPSTLLLLPIEDAPTRGSRTIAQLEAALEEVAADRQELRARTRNGGERIQRDFLALRNREARVRGELATLNADGTKKTFGMGVQDADEFVNAHIFVGGDVDRPAQEVPRGFLQVLEEVSFQIEDGQTSGRLELVTALTSPDNPLTARVMVNRIWLHLIGRPIVGTPNNFGLSGMEPENQELLDFLALQFMENGWSIKSLIREIVLSDTYQRSTEFNEHNYAVDPDNQLRWRANPRQLDAEALRDSMLAISGRLDLNRPAGSAVSEAGNLKLGRGSSIEQFGQEFRYRSVYLPVIRDFPQEGLQLFDFPDANVTSSKRAQSIVPTQALYLMNSDFVSMQAQAMASHLSAQSSNRNDQIREAFLMAYGRPASNEELQACTTFFREFAATPSADETTARARPRGRRQTQSSESPGRRGRQARGDASSESTEARIANLSSEEFALVVFCQSLMASAEFRILD